MVSSYFESKMTKTDEMRSVIQNQILPFIQIRYSNTETHSDTDTDNNNKNNNKSDTDNNNNKNKNDIILVSNTNGNWRHYKYDCPFIKTRYLCFPFFILVSSIFLLSLQSF